MYRAVPFEKYKPSKSPIYSNPESWAVKPDKYSESLKKIIGDSKNKNCDIFFIYPTMFLDRKDTRWNADVDDELLNKGIINRAVKYQASAFGKAGNIYVPFYRQSHYKVYVNPFNKYEEESREIAYSDIKRAFEYYLDNYNNGKPIILVDEYDRENEGDIVIAAEKCNVDNLVFTMNNARGLMCLPAEGSILDRLKLPPMVENNTDPNETPFTVSIDASEGTTTGMSVQDRLRTISVLLDDNSKPEELSRPGHLFPLRARDNLLKVRRGHTEGSIQLMKLAGVKPVAMIVEIMNDDGTMAKGGDLDKFAEVGAMQAEHDAKEDAKSNSWQSTYKFNSSHLCFAPILTRAPLLPRR